MTLRPGTQPATAPSLTQLWRARLPSPARAYTSMPTDGRHVDLCAVRADAHGVRTGHPGGVGGAGRGRADAARGAVLLAEQAGGRVAVEDREGVESERRRVERAAVRRERHLAAGPDGGSGPARAAGGNHGRADAARRAGGLGQRAGARVAEEDADHVRAGVEVAAVRGHDQRRRRDPGRERAAGVGRRIGRKAAGDARLLRECAGRRVAVEDRDRSARGHVDVRSVRADHDPVRVADRARARAVAARLADASALRHRPVDGSRSKMMIASDS